MISLFTGLVTIALLYVTSRLWLLRQNYHIARATGLPIVVCPYDPDGVSRSSSIHNEPSRAMSFPFSASPNTTN
jgi:hypothetical protein